MKHVHDTLEDLSYFSIGSRGSGIDYIRDFATGR